MQCIIFAQAKRGSVCMQLPKPQWGHCNMPHKWRWWLLVAGRAGGDRTWKHVLARSWHKHWRDWTPWIA